MVLLYKHIVVTVSFKHAEFIYI